MSKPNECDENHPLVTIRNCLVRGGSELGYIGNIQREPGKNLRTHDVNDTIYYLNVSIDGIHYRLYMAIDGE
jgi:hypothetical protein